jgi:hypothetical protein
VQDRREGLEKWAKREKMMGREEGGGRRAEDMGNIA